MNGCGETPILDGKNLMAAGVLGKNIWFSLHIPKIKFDPPPQGKMLWCSYFRSFIKLTNFSRTGNFIKKLNFVSTPWKIIIPLGNSVGAIYGLQKCIWVGNDFFYTKLSFFDNFVKKLVSGWSSWKKYLVFPIYPSN